MVLYSFLVAFLSIYHPHGDPLSADCIIGFSFGDGQSHFGKSNVDLARFASENLPHLPKILQWEIDEVYQLKVKPDDPRVSVIERHRLEGDYLDTREVAAQAVAIMHREGWQTAVVLAHQVHIGRAEAVLKKFRIKTVIPAGLGHIRWDKRSTQWYTRNRLFWAIHNGQASLFYFVKGWI